MKLNISNICIANICGPPFPVRQNLAFRFIYIVTYRLQKSKKKRFYNKCWGQVKNLTP